MDQHTGGKWLIRRKYTRLAKYQGTAINLAVKITRVTKQAMRNISAHVDTQICCYISGVFNLIPPTAAYMRQWIGSALVQIMACRLFGAKPLSETMLGYCQLDPKEQTSVKF